MHGCSFTIKRLRAPIRHAFSYGMQHVFIVIHWTMSHSSLNNNENVPYPIYKCMPATSLLTLCTPICQNKSCNTSFTHTHAQGWGTHFFFFFWQGVQPEMWNPYTFLRIFFGLKMADLMFFVLFCFCVCFVFAFLHFCKSGPISKGFLIPYRGHFQKFWNLKFQFFIVLLEAPFPKGI